MGMLASKVTFLRPGRLRTETEKNDRDRFAGEGYNTPTLLMMSYLL